MLQGACLSGGRAPQTWGDSSDLGRLGKSQHSPHPRSSSQGRAEKRQQLPALLPVQRGKEVSCSVMRKAGPL